MVAKPAPSLNHATANALTSLSATGAEGNGGRAEGLDNLTGRLGSRSFELSFTSMALRASELSSSHVADHLSALTEKVDEIAQRAGVSAVARLDLETTLAALPWPSRRRLRLVLESARVGTSDKAVGEAVAMMLALSADVWARTPPPTSGGGSQA